MVNVSQYVTCEFRNAKHTFYFHPKVGHQQNATYYCILHSYVVTIPFGTSKYFENSKFYCWHSEKVVEKIIYQKQISVQIYFVNSMKSYMYEILISRLISGLKLNVNKTTILRVGSLKYTNIQHLENLRFLWTSNSAKTLGIIFSNDKKKLIKNNLIPKLNDFVNCLKRWNHRKLSLMGKITVVKTFALQTYLSINRLKLSTSRYLEKNKVRNF